MEFFDSCFYVAIDNLSVAIDNLLLLTAFLTGATLKNRSVLIYLAVLLIGLSNVSVLGYVQSVLPKPDDRCLKILLNPIDKNEIALIPILLLVSPTLGSSSSSRHQLDIDWRIILVRLCCCVVSAIKLFRVRFSLRQLLL